jgi:brefeldin A-resistance guanine nucleotide exchange factor 1
MPEEHEGQLGFNYAWKELLHRAESAGINKMNQVILIE